MKYGQPNQAAVDAFKNNASKFSMIVFGGTWCNDTQNLLPVFYKLVNKSGYPENKFTLVAVDTLKLAPTIFIKLITLPTFLLSLF